MENVNIHGIKTNQCPICVVPDGELCMVPKTPYSHRDHLDYKKLYKAGDVSRYVVMTIARSVNSS